jgi:hypothetical protein
MIGKFLEDFRMEKKEINSASFFITRASLHIKLFNPLLTVASIGMKGGENNSFSEDKDSDKHPTKSVH